MKHRARFRPFRKRPQENTHVAPSTAMIAYGWRERAALHTDVESDPLVCEPDLPAPRASVTARITQILMDDEHTIPDMDEWKTKTMETAIVGIK